MRPEHLDRRLTRIGPLHDGDVAAGPWLVTGVPAGVQARTLSRSADGAATALLNVPAGWSSGMVVPGSSLGIFVISGAVRIGTADATAYSLSVVPADTPVEIGSTAGALVLAYQDGPLWFSDSGADSPTTPEVVRPGARAWTPASSPDHSGLLVKPLAEYGGTRVAMVGALHWSPGRWRTSRMAEEWFVLEGSVLTAEHEAGAVRRFRLRPGSYVWRPPEAWHLGPGSGTSTYAVALVRVHGDPRWEWADSPDDR